MYYLDVTLAIIDPDELWNHTRAKRENLSGHQG